MTRYMDQEVDGCYATYELFTLMGSEVDKIFKILIKSSYASEYIESDIQDIEAPRIDDHII